jgi:hypothetical protein
MSCRSRCSRRQGDTLSLPFNVILKAEGRRIPDPDSGPYRYASG